MSVASSGLWQQVNGPCQASRGSRVQAGGVGLAPGPRRALVGFGDVLLPSPWRMPPCTSGLSWSTSQRVRMVWSPKRGPRAHEADGGGSVTLLVWRFWLPWRLRGGAAGPCMQALLAFTRTAAAGCYGNAGLSKLWVSVSKQVDSCPAELTGRAAAS